MKWTIAKKLAFLGGILLAAFFVLAGITYNNISKIDMHTKGLNKSFEILAANNALAPSLFSAESAQRSYLLGGSQGYLKQYRASVAETRSTVLRLKELTSDDKQLKKMTEDLDNMLASRLNSLEMGIDMYDKGMADEYIRLINDGVGINLMNKVEDAKDFIEKTEKSKLNQQTEILAENNHSAQYAIIWGIGITLLLMFGTAYYTSRNISTPLSRLADIANTISQGNLSQKPIRTEARSDEIGILTDAFIQMHDYLDRMSHIAESLSKNDLSVQVDPLSDQDNLGISFALMTDNLRLMVSDVKDAARMISGSSSQIAALTSQLAASSTETAAAVSETSTTLEEIKVTANQVNQKSAFVSESARNTAQMTQNGQKSVNETLAGMSKIKEQMTFIADSIVRLSEQSIAIGEIISSVGDLASQSNLLARECFNRSSKSR